LNLEGDQDVNLFAALVQTLRSEGLEESRRQEIADLLSEVTEAFCVDTYRERGNTPIPEPDQTQKKQMDVVTEKRCLQEVNTIYGKMVDRLGQFDRLSFEDSQLQEASRCYLYGFFRACVILSAAALETHLKRITKINYSELYYNALVSKAVEMQKLDDAHAAFATLVFNERREVAHYNKAPDADKAAEVLDSAREVLSILHE
jgi:hypothetical protein